MDRLSVRRAKASVRGLGLISAIGGAYLLGRTVLAEIYVGGRPLPIGDAAEDHALLAAFGSKIYVVSALMIALGAAMLLLAERRTSEPDGED